MFRIFLVLSALVAPLAPAFAADNSADSRKAVSTNAAPAAIGPYSQAILANGVLYASGQIALDPRTGQMAAADIRGQTRQVLANLSAVLASSGMSLDDAVQVQIFLADLADFEAMNEVYASAFKAPYPARFTVQVARLPRDARVEIGLIAVKRAR